MRIVSIIVSAILGCLLPAFAAESLPPGVIIDRSPDFARMYVGCPAIAILPNGQYVASHSWFGPGTKNDSSEVFGSADRGRTWTHLASLQGQWWSSLFVHRGDLYIFGVTREYGHIVIRRSRDGGRTWTEPKDAQTGRLTEQPGYHCAPVPLAVHRGRIWRAFELAGGWYHELAPKAGTLPKATGYNTGKMGDLLIHPRPAWPCLVISAPENADLLDARQWRMSQPLAHPESKSQWIEGNVLVAPDGSLVNVLRTNPQGETARLQRTSAQAVIVHVAEDGLSLSYNPARDLVSFPGGGTKFTIRYDDQTRRYWSVPNRQTDPADYRNILVLASSPDLRAWRIEATLLQHPDSRNHAWQYVDWVLEGDDILAVSRTAWDGSRGAHDANYFTFHRISRFRTLTPASPPLR